MVALPPGWTTLSIDEKWATVELMLADMNAEDSQPISDELRLELRNRLAAHDQNPERAVPWEFVKAELMADE